MAKWLSDAQKSFKVEVNRNSFDLSKTRNASYNFGFLYPMFCIPVSPNESYQVRTSGGFDLKPTIGVPQTHVKCNTAWFYVRDRQVWSHAKKFLMQDKSKTTSVYAHPLINTNDASAFRKGSLLHHLGVPVMTCGVYQSNAIVSVVDSSFENLSTPAMHTSLFNRPSVTYSVNPSFSYSFLRRSFDSWESDSEGDLYCHRPICPFMANPTIYDPSILGSMLENYYSPTSGSRTVGVLFPLPMVKRVSDYDNVNPWSFIFHHIDKVSNGERVPFSSNLTWNMAFFAGSVNPVDASLVLNISFSNSSPSEGSVSVSSPVSKNIQSSRLGDETIPVYTTELSLIPNKTAVRRIQDVQDKYGELYVLLYFSTTAALNSSIVTGVFAGNVNRNPGVSEPEPKPVTYDVTPGFYNGFSYKSDVLINNDVSSPFLGIGDDAKEHLNALPVRAYEAVFNSHFRDRILDPFMVDGVVAIDQYNTNLGDGLDSTTPLVLQKVRYESDYFTTCVPSPQGNMFHQPLVGITVASNPDANSAVATYSEDGTTYDVEFKIDGDGKMIGMNFNSEDADRLTILTLQDAIQYGISLQDLQDKRALSKWYEATYRRGRYSYDEFIGAHYGKVPTRDEMHAPEYLGGDSLPLSMMRVLNNSLSGGPLGASGGLGSFATRRDNPGEVECYCDEDGFIIGVCWFSVTPTYGQAISKFWYRKMPFDYSTPEFADLGTMPVLNKELCPLQCNWDDATSSNYADGTFGYQRQYGDKLQAFDDIAGDYSDELSNLILFRRFDSVPSLGVDFVTQDPSDLNNVFVLDDEKDKIYGQWHFDVVCKTWLQSAPNAQIF